MERSVYSVSELNRHIKLLLDGDALLQSVCVQGELSNYKVYPSGHHYFTLKDAEGSIRCVMFKSNTSGLRFRPENGMGVVAFGRVTVYPRDGAYQLYCTALAPRGMGDLYAAFERLKQRLGAEGLFDPGHKKPIPRYPTRIAVITSGAGAAVRDIIRVCGARWPMAKLLVLPVRVQGAEAPAEIAGALRYANRWQVADLIITGRGGGSIEDLWAFNDERVARAIYDSALPVISAVGHEPDVTIADYVADLRAATPSNGAERATPSARELRETLESISIRCRQAVAKQLEFYRRTLEDLRRRRVMESPLGYVELKRMELDLLQARLGQIQEARLGRERRRYAALAAKLDALSPLKVLSRGYAVAETAAGAVVRALEDVETGERIAVFVSDGALQCLVEEKQSRNTKEEDRGHGAEEKAEF